MRYAGLCLLKNRKIKMARRLEILSQYDFSIIHRQGSKHGNADFLSRACEPTTCDCYDGQTILSDLSCSGCCDCLKKHEEWSSFMKYDNIVPLKLNRTMVVESGPRKSVLAYRTIRRVKNCVVDYIKWLFIPFFLWTANVSFIKDIKFLDFFATGVKNSR